MQTNWKASPSWQLQNEDEIGRFMALTDRYFQEKYSFDIYKKNSLTQLLMQAEVDAVGVCLTECGAEIHAIDVAFHESGLNYGNRQETVTRIIKKFLRTSFCMIGYFGISAGEIIFASPKINNAELSDLAPCISDLNALYLENGYHFTARVIANDDFNEHVLKPILIAGNSVCDTSELFMRGYQLLKMFENEKPLRQRTEKPKERSTITGESLSELKIGKVAQTLLREALENGKADDEELSFMQTKDYSKETFGINYPLLLLAAEASDLTHYYKKPLTIYGKAYYLCQEWFESPANNDRPLLDAWLNERAKIDADTTETDA